MKTPASEAPDSSVGSLLRLRAERLAKPEAIAEIEQEGLAIASFPIGDAEYAIPLRLLCAAIPIKAVVPVPLAARQVVGVLRFRGDIITVLSLASLLGAGGWRVDPAVLLVVETAHQLMAFDCEQIPRASTISAAAAREALARDPGPVVEVVTSASSSVFLIEVNRLVERWQATEPHAG